MPATDNTRLYYGKGQIFIAERSPLGQPIAFDFVGNVSELTINPKTEKVEHREDQGGKNLKDKVIEIAQDSELSITMDSATKENFKRMIFGSESFSSAGTIVEERVLAFKGQSAKLSRINLSSFTSLTNLAKTFTYQLNTHYTVDLDHGLIHFPPTANYANGATVLATYVAGSSEIVAAYNSINSDYYLLYNGINLAEEEAPVSVRMFRVRFAPPNEIPIISSGNEFAKYQQSGDILFDAKQPRNGLFGRYFSVEQKLVVEEEAGGIL